MNKIKINNNYYENITKINILYNLKKKLFKGEIYEHKGKVKDL